MNNEEHVNDEELRDWYEEIMGRYQEVRDQLDTIFPLGLLDKVEGPPELNLKEGDVLSSDDVRAIDAFFDYWGVEDVALIDEPEDFVPDSLKRSLCHVCEKILCDENLSFSPCTEELPSIVSDFLDTLDIIYWHVQSGGFPVYLGDSIAKEIFLALKYDALLKAVYENERKRLKDGAFTVSTLEKKECSYDWFSFNRLLELRNKLFPKRKPDTHPRAAKKRSNLSPCDDKRKNREFNTKSADIFAQQYGDDMLFPFFAFALLTNTNLTRLLSDYDDYDDSKKVKNMDYVLIKMKSWSFFGKNEKERDFQKSMSYLYLFLKCLNGESFYPQGDPLVVPHFTEPQRLHVPRRMSWEYKEYLQYEILENTISSTFSPATERKKLMAHVALNLYCFNDTTGLLDWLYATKNMSSSCIYTEGMLFSKRAKIMWYALGSDEQKLVVDAYNYIFNILYQYFSELGVDELLALYVDEEDHLDDLAYSMLQDIAGFHYLYGQIVTDKNLKNSREQPQKRLYDTVREHTKNRNI